MTNDALPPLDWTPEQPLPASAIRRTAPAEAPRALDALELIDSRASFAAALRRVIDDAMAGDARQLWLCDRHFADWPLGERDVIDRLSVWVGDGRRLTLIADHYDWIAVNAPRFVDWRRRWLHLVDCAVAHRDDAPHLPGLVLVPKQQQIRLSDRELFRGRCSITAADLSASTELIDATMQRIEGEFAATTLGLA